MQFATSFLWIELLFVPRKQPFLCMAGEVGGDMNDCATTVVAGNLLNYPFGLTKSPISTWTNRELWKNFLRSTRNSLRQFSIELQILGGSHFFYSCCSEKLCLRVKPPYCADTALTNHLRGQM